MVRNSGRIFVFRYEVIQPRKNGGAMPKVNCYCMNSVFTLSFQRRTGDGCAGYIGRIFSQPPLFFEICVSDRPGEKFGFYPADLPAIFRCAIARAILKFESRSAR